MSATTDTFDPYNGDTVLAENVECLIEWGLGDGRWEPRDEDGKRIVGAVILDECTAVITDADAPDEDGQPIRAFVPAAGGELVYVIVKADSEPREGDNGIRVQILHTIIDAPFLEGPVEDAALALELLEAIGDEVPSDQEIRSCDEDVPTRERWSVRFWACEDTPEEEIERLKAYLAERKSA